MVGFVIGLFVGAVVAIMVMGFLVVVAEDDENKRKPPEELRWYMEDDGK